MSAPFLLAPLAAAQDRSAFRSGSEPLDRYLREQVTQDVRRRVAACFVALADGARIAGYYTLASAGLLLVDLPASTRAKLPRYPSVPTVRMGRLAVDLAFQGQGLGAALLLDIGTARLSSYLYGRVQNVPPEIMERARGLSIENNRFARDLRARFGPDVPMSKLLADWEKQLGIRPSSNTRLARALSPLVPSTVSRWRAGKGRPSMFDLARLDQRVRESKRNARNG